MDAMQYTKASRLYYAFKCLVLKADRDGKERCVSALTNIVSTFFNWKVYNLCLPVHIKVDAGGNERLRRRIVQQWKMWHDTQCTIY